MKGNITKVIEHPLYNPDLAPLDLWLFSKLNCHLRGNHFQNDEVKAKVKKRFQEQPKQLFNDDLEFALV